MNLRDLEYLVAVADEKHFGKAARACHVSQPGLSGQIRKIEDLLGVTVFERSKRHVAITPEGERVIAQARIVLSEARKLWAVAKAHETKKPLSGTLRLGVIATLGPYLLPLVLKPLRKKYPDLRLILREGLTDELVLELKSGRLDAILASDTFPEDGLLSTPLFDEPFWVALPKDHRLAQRDEIRPGDLRPSEMVVLDDGHCLKDQALNLCPANVRGGGLRQFHATSIETLRYLVASGHGYTLIPQLAVRDASELGGMLVYRPLEGRAARRRIVLACRKSFPGVGHVEALGRFLIAFMPSVLS